MTNPLPLLLLPVLPLESQATVQIWFGGRKVGGAAAGQGRVEAVSAAAFLAAPLPPLTTRTLSRCYCSVKGTSLWH